MLPFLIKLITKFYYYYYYYQINYPLCTIATKPRLPEHCIEYAKIILWPKEKPFGGE